MSLTPSQYQLTTLGKLCTPMCLCHQAVPAKERWGEDLHSAAGKWPYARHHTGHTVQSRGQVSVNGLNRTGHTVQSRGQVSVNGLNRTGHTVQSRGQVSVNGLNRTGHTVQSRGQVSVNGLNSLEREMSTVPMLQYENGWLYLLLQLNRLKSAAAVVVMTSPSGTAYMGGQRCPEEIRNSTRLWIRRDPSRSLPRDSWQPFYWLRHHSQLTYCQPLSNDWRWQMSTNCQAAVGSLDSVVGFTGQKTQPTASKYWRKSALQNHWSIMLETF